MPETLTPPPGAAHDAGVLLLWCVGALIFSIGVIWWRLVQVTKEKDALYAERITSGEQTATLLTEVRAALAEARAATEALKAASYELRDELREAMRDMRGGV